jgi:hypothetical protein
MLPPRGTLPAVVVPPEVCGIRARARVSTSAGSEIWGSAYRGSAEALAWTCRRQFGRDCRKSASGCRKCRFEALWLPFFLSAVSQLRQRPVVVSDRDPASGLVFGRLRRRADRGDSLVSPSGPCRCIGGGDVTLASSPACARLRLPPVVGFCLRSSSVVRDAPASLSRAGAIAARDQALADAGEIEAATSAALAEGARGDAREELSRPYRRYGGAEGPSATRWR